MTLKTKFFLSIGGAAICLVFAVTLASEYVDSASQYLILPVAGIGALLVAAGLTNVLSALWETRLAAFAAGLEAVRSSGDLSIRLNDQSRDAVALLARAVDRLLDHIQEVQALALNVARGQVLAGVATQLAHDVRSPLAALETVLANTKGIEEDKRVMIRTATRRIKDIANQLQEVHNQDHPGQDRGIRQRPYHVGMLVETVISEKRVRYADQDKLVLEYLIAEEALDLFLDVEQHVLKRLLSVLIDSAVDSCRNRQGRVVVELNQVNGIAIFKVSDDGFGIHPDKIKKIMTDDSKSAANGPATGLAFVRKKCDELGIEFVLESGEKKPTLARLKIGSIPPPAWFTSSVNIREGAQVVIADDDPSIHLVWGNRLAHGPVLVNVQTIEAFEAKIGELKAGGISFFCLVDYEFVGSTRNGIDAIKKLDISSVAVLVTSRHAEEQVIDRCLDLRIKMIPKGIAPVIPIKFVTSGCKYVFLDDDPFIAEAWEMDAAQKNIDLTTFSDYRKLLAVAPDLPNDTLFYLDHNLGGDVSGVDVAKKLQRLGFKEIFLSTGYDPENFKNEKVIKGVFGKDPPF